MVDEHASLRLTVESLSDKIRVKEEEKHAADAESSKMLQELMTLKGALADRANADNDQFINKCATLTVTRQVQRLFATSVLLMPCPASCLVWCHPLRATEAKHACLHYRNS